MQQLDTGSESALYQIDSNAPILKDFDHLKPISAVVRALPDLASLDETEVGCGFAFDCSLGLAVLGPQDKLTKLFDELLAYMRTTLNDPVTVDDLADEEVNNLFMFQFDGLDLFCLVVGGYTQDLPEAAIEIITKHGLETLEIGAWANDLDVTGVIFQPEAQFVFEATHNPATFEEIKAQLEPFKPEGA